MDLRSSLAFTTSISSLLFLSLWRKAPPIVEKMASGILRAMVASEFAVVERFEEWKKGFGREREKVSRERRGLFILVGLGIYANTQFINVVTYNVYLHLYLVIDVYLRCSELYSRCEHLEYLASKE